MIDGSISPPWRTCASLVARTAASAITSTPAPADAGPRDGAIDHAPQDRLQPVVARGMEVVGLGGREQDAVGARAQQRAEEGPPADLEAVEDRLQARLRGRAPLPARH